MKYVYGVLLTGLFICIALAGATIPFQNVGRDNLAWRLGYDGFIGMVVFFVLTAIVAVWHVIYDIEKDV